MADEKMIIEAEPNRAFLENRRMSLDAGVLGYFFGTGTASSTNIAGFVIFMLVLAGLVTLVIDTKMPAADYWKLAAPMITGAMGFIFGARKP